MQALRGTIHGKTIELQDVTGMLDGAQVEVFIRVYSPSSGEPGAGLRRCAGILADSRTDQDDLILEQLQQDRLQSASRSLPE